MLGKDLPDRNRRKIEKISPDDLKIANQDALELFFSGIRSDEAKRTMSGNLKRFLVDACEDVLSGDLPHRAQQFVNLARDDQQRTTQIILAYIKQLKARTKMPKDSRDYLNPSSVPNQIKPIKKLLDMSGLGLGWKRIHSTYPEMDNTYRGRGYTRDEIKILLEHSDSLATDFIVLAASSGGLRIGAWNNLTWDCVFPIYKIHGNNDDHDQYSMAEPDENASEIVCAAMIVYRGTPDEYVALISREAWEKLGTYRRELMRQTDRIPEKSDPLILARFLSPTALSANGVRNRIESLVARSGLREPLKDGRRRHEVPATHGFRRYWDKVMMEASRKSDTLSALVKKERLLGHGGLVKTDKNYYWTDVLDLVPEYLAAMPELTISDEYRLQQRLTLEKDKSGQLEKANAEKEDALSRLKELEAKVERMQRYQVIT